HCLYARTSTLMSCLLSLQDALPICGCGGALGARVCRPVLPPPGADPRRDPGAAGNGALNRPGGRSICSADANREQDRGGGGAGRDRKSTRLNTSHVKISYVVVCLER